jgi:hypothetical protein
MQQLKFFRIARVRDTRDRTPRFRTWADSYRIEASVRCRDRKRAELEGRDLIVNLLAGNLVLQGEEEEARCCST